MTETGARADAERRLEATAPGYLAKVRAAASRLAHRDGASAGAHTALADVRELARFDVDVPTNSRQRPARLVKVAVKRLVGWYLRYLSQQMSAFGEAVGRLGDELLERGDQLDRRTSAVAGELEALRARVERLEAGGAGSSPEPPAP